MELSKEDVDALFGHAQTRKYPLGPRADVEQLAKFLVQKFELTDLSQVKEVLMAIVF